MKKIFYTLVLWSLFFACDKAPDPIRPSPIDTLGGVREQYTLSDDDIFEGHPFFWPYLPGEERISLDTLRNTNLMMTIAYADTLGWGAAHYSYYAENYHPSLPLSLPAVERTVWSTSQRWPERYNRSSIVWTSGRFSSTTNGMLEYSDYGGKINTKFADMYRPYFSPITSSISLSKVILELHAAQSNSEIRRRLEEDGYSLFITSANSYPRNFFSDMVGNDITWGAASGYYSERLRHSVRDPITNQTAYLPKILRVLPLGKEVADEYHHKDSSLTITWEGDFRNPNQKFLVVVTNYHTNFVTFPHYTTAYPLAKKSLAASRGVVFFPPNREKSRSPWDYLEDNTVEGGTPTRWYQTVEETAGTNTFTIPAEVFADALEGEYFDIRCFRWNDEITHVPPIEVDSDGSVRWWLIGPGTRQRESVRSHFRAVSMSVGRVIIHE